MRFALVILAVMALSTVSALNVATSINKLAHVVAINRRLGNEKAAVEKLALESEADKEWVQARTWMTSEINKRVAKAKMSGELKLGGCLKKESSFEITPADLDGTSFTSGTGVHEGYLDEYKTGLSTWDGVFTIPFSVSVSASWFIGVTAQVGINLESYPSGKLLVRPCWEASLTLGLSVGAGASFNFGLFFGDSEYGAEANLQLGGTVSAGIGLSLNVLLRLGPGDDKAATETALNTAAATAVTAEANTAEDAPVKKSASKAFFQACIDKVKSLKKSAIIGLVFGVEVGFKYEGPKYGIKDGALKSIGEGFIAGLFSKLLDKIKDMWASCKSGKCKKVWDKLAGMTKTTDE